MDRANGLLSGLPTARRVFFSAALAVCAGVFLSCRSAVDAEGRILRISIATTGVDLDTNGYSYRLVGPTTREGRIAPNGTVEIEGLPEGEYEVELGDVSANCTLGEGSRRSVNVPWRMEASFAVSCVESVGSLRISFATVGSDPDRDGFEVRVDDGASRRVPPNGATTFEGVPTGEPVVTVGDVAANCRVPGGTSRTVTVAFREMAELEVRVECVSRFGVVQVAMETTGPDPDADGYLVGVVGEGTPVRVGPNETMALPEVPSGTQSVELSDVASNCDVADPNPRSVEVPPGGGAVAVSFRVECLATTADLTVQVRTTGEDADTDGYRAVLDGQEEASLPSQGSVVFPSVAAGDHTVELSEVADNCAVEGTNPREFSIAYGDGDVSLTFDVVCSAAEEESSEGGGDRGDDRGDDAGDGEEQEEEESGGMHVGGLEGRSLDQGKIWEARVEVLVHDDEERGLSDVKVKAAWSQKGDGTRSCTTGSEGVCELRLEGIRKNEKKVTLRVTDLVHASRVYTAQLDHGGDSESGSEITVSKP